MTFRTYPEISLVKGKDLLVLDERLEYYDVRSKELFVIEAGFTYDGASIPQMCQSFVGSPFDEEFRLASGLHDFLYRNKVVSKQRADQMFYDALIESGVSYYKAQAMYLGVKAFGRNAYDKKMKNPI